MKHGAAPVRSETRRGGKRSSKAAWLAKAGQRHGPDGTKRILEAIGFAVKTEDGAGSCRVSPFFRENRKNPPGIPPCAIRRAGRAGVTHALPGFPCTPDGTLTSRDERTLLSRLSWRGAAFPVFSAARPLTGSVAIRYADRSVPREAGGPRWERQTARRRAGGAWYPPVDLRPCDPAKPVPWTLPAFGGALPALSFLPRSPGMSSATHTHTHTQLQLLRTG